MSIDIREISESEYQKLNVPVLFEDELTNRTFATASDGRHVVKFGWQSTMIKPMAIKVRDNIYGIGIDLNFAIVDFDDGKIRLQLSLDHFFYDVVTKKKFVIIITELEVIQVGVDDLEVIKKYELPDYFKELKFTEQGITITCIGSETIDIETT
jgi:hypothetical protein